MLRGNLTKRLEDIRVELQRDREALRILEEQVAFQAAVADEATTNAIVAETPLAHRERREADTDLQRLRRQRDDIKQRVAVLVAEQDDILDRMVEQAGGQ